MFRIKVCGITRAIDAVLASEVGVDAIGLNFYPGSRRYVTPEQAAEIVEHLSSNVLRVGLFVNATDDEICRIYDHLQLDMIQLHGDEAPDFLLSLGQRPVIRAFRLGESGVGPMLQYVEQCRSQGTPPSALLVDAHQPGQYGGTGMTADWDLLHRERPLLADLPLVLAGGLTHENVAEAISRVVPDAVDTASGVESAPGQKDPTRMQKFTSSALAAFASLNR